MQSLIVRGKGDGSLYVNGYIDDLAGTSARLADALVEALSKIEVGK